MGALRTKPSLVREGVKFPLGYLSKKAELSSEDAYGIFYGSESFSCYFPKIDVALNYK